MADMTMETMDLDTPAGFVVDNDIKADWAVRKIKDMRDEADRLAAIAEAQIDELQSKIDTIYQKRDAETAFLTQKLNEYFDTVPHKDAKTQSSYKLLSGSLVQKKPKVAYKRDVDKLTAWLMGNGYGNYVETVHVPSWQQFKKEIPLIANAETGIVCVQATGEVVDGLTAEEQPGKFEVKV